MMRPGPASRYLERRHGGSTSESALAGLRLCLRATPAVQSWPGVLRLSVLRVICVTTTQSYNRGGSAGAVRIRGSRRSCVFSGTSASCTTGSSCLCRSMINGRRSHAASGLLCRSQTRSGGDSKGSRRHVGVVMWRRRVGWRHGACRARAIVVGSRRAARLTPAHRAPVWLGASVSQPPVARRIVGPAHGGAGAAGEGPEGSPAGQHRLRRPGRAIL
jgi:hypothetical protein